MRAALWRRVMMLLFGVSATAEVQAPLPAPRFGDYPLHRRVMAGLLGVSLERVAVSRSMESVPLASAVNGFDRPSPVSRPDTDGEEGWSDVECRQPLFVPQLTLAALRARPNGEARGELLPAPALAPARTNGRLHLLVGVLAGALGVGGLLVGFWATVLAQGRPESGPSAAKELGSVVTVAEPLEVGDCVMADWPGAARFEGVPQVTVDPTCAGSPDGQVIAVVPAANAAQAEGEGPEQCEQRTKEVREKLADVRSFALVPTPESFQAAGRRTACLVLGAHGPVYGPLDVHRKIGSAFTDTATMQRDDCLDVLSSRGARLASCAGPHDEQVLGFTRLGDDVSLAEARTRSDAACAREVPPRDYGFDPTTFTVASWTSEGHWRTGTHIVVCTVRRTDGSPMPAIELTTTAPSSSAPAAPE
ncbi:septum formation family protein [Streptomyces sp. NPDC019531]|uniref:septum formation family protein n=1 Tax=Streptomyces sp. NPDC019531 TaxID=3365062 RepID=UPI00384E522B